MAAVLYWYLWIRATFPRYRYDQIMRLGWKVLIPIGFAYIVIFGRVDDFTAEFVEISFRRHLEAV